MIPELSHQIIIICNKNANMKIVFHFIFEITSEINEGQTDGQCLSNFVGWGQTQTNVLPTNIFYCNNASGKKIKRIRNLK